MTRYVALLVVLGGWGTPLGAQSIKLPATVNVPSPGLVIVTPESVDGDAVAYFPLDTGLQEIPPRFRKDTGEFLGFAMGTGSYRVRAVAAKAINGKASLSPVAECVVVVGSSPVPPPPPPPPIPTDPFSQAVAAAYAKETATDRASQVAFLAAFYKGAGTLLDLPTTTTAGGLFTELSTRIHDPTNGIPKGSLPLVSKVIGQDLNQVLGGSTDPVPVGTAVDPAKVKAAFQRYAQALSGLR